ncbi:unnamed protein product [Cuscuta campestris]|uniref:Reverse transcriptase/retrotransposon-derived protein RNase H-like domain-containing protein n=1 Tax=Cuscuta campestris TaxID=132261 RepID=A0A484LT76_9ASTE|nr:unnamed protein product [Cuscuta campestris]
MAGRRTRRNPAASAQSTVRSDNPEQGMIVPVNGLETALNNVANMMANIMERLDKALPGPSGTRGIPVGQPRQVLRTASSPILHELHDPEEVERERQAIDRRRAEELARNNKVNEGQAKDASRIICNGNENPRRSVFERISRQKAHVSERLGKNPEKAPQGWMRPQASQVASSNREPRQQNGRGESQVLVWSLRNLEEDEVNSQARVPAPRRLGPPVPETGEFQDLRQQIQEMQRKINKGRVFTTRTNTPLALEIFAEPYPQGFKMPFVKRYDGESDPQEHINSYVQVMIAVDASDALMCRCFLQTVDSKKHGESLKNFLIRWRKESREVEGTDDKSRLAMFTAALQDGLLHTDLTTHPPDTFEEAMVRAGRYVTLEERKEEKKEKTPKEEEKTENKKPFKNKKQGFPDGPKGASPGTSEKHKSANPVFTLPVAEVMTHAAQQGLMTYPTYSQKVCNVEDTENDDDAGNPGNAQNGKRRDKEVAQAEAQEKRHIGLEDKEEDSEPAPHRQKRHHGCNFIIGGNTGVPHRDALVITIDIMDLLIHKTLVDTGSSVNIMYMDTYKALGLTRDELSPIKTPLTGFTGDSIEPEGVITLPVEIGDAKATRKLDMEFVVVGIISNTNIILGRPGLEDLECVISPRHLCIKFPTPHGVGIARGSQRVSRAWYLKATKQPVKYDTQVGEVTAQLLRAEEKRPRVEVAGDIEEVELEPGTPGRLVRIGKDLGAELRSRVISVLRRFMRVFAWSPVDMPGLDHKIAVHRLNVLPDAKPGGKFLGYMVSRKGIEANLEKVRAIMEMEPPKTAKGVQRLTGRLAALNRFLSKLAEKAHPFFAVIKKRATFKWTQECQEAFEELKRYLTSPLVLSKPEPRDILTLYLAIADCAISTVIVREERGAQHPVYYVTKTLRDAELRYSRPEKAMLAVFWTAKRLTPYFQAHRIVVLTNEPLASLTRSLAASARMTKWAVFISQYNVEFRPRPSIKGQALADFQVECTAREMTRAQVETRVEKDWWVMSIDGSSGSRSCGAGIVLITPEKFRIYYAIRFQFRVSNNEAEYEALINGLKILSKMGVSRVQNAEADVLSKLGVELSEYISKLATVEELVTPSLSRSEVIWVSADPLEWLDRLAKYIEDGEAPEDPQEARLLRMRAPTYKVQDGILNKQFYNGVLLRCLRAAEAKALMEEIHEGVCAAHQGAGQARWIVVAIDYFTKWVEAEPLAGITGRQMIDFVGTNILCRTTPRRATGDTPFGLAYGFEARAPAEVVIPTRREMDYDPEVNERNQAVELNFVEERRDEAWIRAENYRRQVKSYFDSKVKPRAFQVGDYVLRKREKSQPTKGGKLAKKYEGPYIIKAVVRPGTYKLVTPKGKKIDRTWNVEHLVKFYQ